MPDRSAATFAEPESVNLGSFSLERGPYRREAVNWFAGQRLNL